MSDSIAEITGKVIDVGTLPEGRGFMLEVDGQEITLTGLTVEETKSVGALLGQRLTITVRRSDSISGES